MDPELLEALRKLQFGEDPHGADSARNEGGFMTRHLRNPNVLSALFVAAWMGIMVLITLVIPESWVSHGLFPWIVIALSTPVVIVGVAFLLILDDSHRKAERARQNKYIQSRRKI